MTKQANLIETPNGVQYAAARQYPMDQKAQKAHGFIATVNRSITGRVVKAVADRSGVTALEYGIITGVLGLVLIVVFETFDKHITILFKLVEKAL